MTRARLPIACAGIHLVAASLMAPLAAQAPPQRREEPAAWVAQAEQRLAEADAAEALRLVRRALPLLQGTDDAVPRSRALRVRCWAAVEARPDSVLAWARAALADSTIAVTGADRASLRACHGYGLEGADRADEAFREYDAAVAGARAAGDPEILADALLLRGQLRYYFGDFSRALEDLTEAYRAYRRTNGAAAQRNSLNALNGLANVYADPRVGQYARALEYYRQVLAANRASGSQRGIATAYFNLAATQEQMGLLTEALRDYRRGLEMDLLRGDSAEAAVDRRAIGIVLYKLGLPAQALATLDTTLRYALAHGDAELVAQTRLSRGVALRLLGRPREALAELDAARTRFAATGSNRFLEKTQDERAQALAAAGDWEGAYRARSEQLALERRLGEAAREESASRLRVQFDAEKKEAENRALSRENALRGRALGSAARVRRLQLAVLLLSGGVIVALVLLVARQVAAARRLRVISLTDELTHLPNRRHLYRLAGDAERAARSRGAGFAVVAIDVDHFKRINDRWGHAAGDAVLRRVARTARGALRQGDHLGRTGGEEFVAILPGAPAHAARQVAERLRAAVEQTSFRDVDPELAVTVSAGVALWSDGGEGFEEVFRRADASLYEAKLAGRNQVHVAPAA